MNHKNEETVHNIKTPGLISHETYVLTHKRFNTYMVLTFSVLNKAQIYKMPYRDSPHHEIEILMSFIYPKLFQPNKHTERYHIRKLNNENFLSEMGYKKYLCGGKVIVSEKKL